MLSLHRRYGDVVSLARGNPEYVFVFSAEYNRQVLSDQMLFFNGEVNSPASPIRIPPRSAVYRLFSGITTRNGEQHTRQRRMLMPAFHKKRIEALRDEMATITDRYVSRWSVGEERDALHDMKSLTLAVAMRGILGLDPEREGDALREQMERWLRLTLSASVVALPYNVPGLPFRRMMASAEGLERNIRSLIQHRREAAGGDRAAGRDALSILVEAHDEDGSRLTDDELIGHTTALFVAGHETTASALTWTLFLLDRHPRVLDALLDELEGELHGDQPTVEQMSRLPLLDGVINESLRLFPPGLWFLRVPTEPVRFGQYEVGEHTRILWTPVVTHRDPRIYEKPNNFVPERWAKINPSPYEYMPFGAGPRRCLGATFAIMEMKVVLPTILQRYRLALRPGAKVELGGSPLAAPRGGLPVRVLSKGARVPASEVTGNAMRLAGLAPGNVRGRRSGRR
jgi:cytochrome P450